MKAAPTPLCRTRRSLAIVALVCGVAAGTVVLVVRTHHPRATLDSDCATVQSVANDWVSLQRSVEAAVENGPGESGDLKSAADQEFAMSDKLRAAAHAVSAPTLEKQLTKWAEGVELTAQIQRGSVNRPVQIELPADLKAQLQRSAAMTGQAVDALVKACPSTRETLKPS